MTATRIYTYDSTLRDGEQCEGITLSLADKLAIVRRLDEFGIDYIEGGFPASNPKDVAFFREVAAMDLKHAQIAAFGSTCKKGVAAAGVDVQAVLDDIKAREAAGFTYEVADGSLGLLLMRHLGLYAPAFTLESFRVIVDDREDTGALAKDALSEATVKIHVGEGRFVATGESAGPVGALDAALRMAILESYPQVAAMELTDYKVRLLDESQGTDAITRVTITATDGVDTWGTVGVSENVIEASWNALVDSLEYGLFRARVRA